MESYDIQFDRLASKLLVELENLRKAESRKDFEGAEEITYRKGHLLQKIRLLIDKEYDEKQKNPLHNPKLNLTV